MLAVRAIGMLLLALAAGCAGVKEAAPDPMAQSRPMRIDPAAIVPIPEGPLANEPPRSGTKEEAAVESAPPPAPPLPPPMTGDKAVEIEPAAGAATPLAPPSTSASAAKAAPPPAKVPAKVPATPVVIEQTRKNTAPPPVARTPEPPLDVAALKARLRDTNAIGIFTKLTLKNQVDDLLQQFREHYLSGQNTSVAALRQPYDMLVLKVLALVQDSDPPLARTISGSREAIWSILADPQKFKSAI